MSKQPPETNKPEQDKGKNIEVWEDLVNIKDLLLSMVICSALALGGYLIAPNEPPRPLIYGLVGVVIGFIISSIIIKPKRTLRFEDEES
ncbi:hypothetical protein KFZ58_02525 [Virgibacillus sp. NKC19-16]|uniref:hypothetical protein n=1 Tax=Virgibacillus salidurans TaxID=2831673 RepID=UPI001F1809E8|nr:hypothetical protein [Virgibacillus sp. NKC19-16]UJL46846.1 hypothetical protein KFZ58_02525 [Virgibacillus sp. NKC19-16]